MCNCLIVIEKSRLKPEQKNSRPNSVHYCTANPTLLDSLIEEEKEISVKIQQPFENKHLTKKQCLIHLFKKKETSVSPSKRCIFAPSHQLVILVLIFNDGYVLSLKNLCFKQYFEISIEDTPKNLSLHFEPYI